MEGTDLDPVVAPVEGAVERHGERVGCPGGRWAGAVPVGRDDASLTTVHAAAHADGERLERRRRPGEHLRSVEDVGADGAALIRGHVQAVGPDAVLHVVVRPWQVELVEEPVAGRIAGLRVGDAHRERAPGPRRAVGVGELAEHEPIGLLVVQYDRIADVLVSALVEPRAGGRAIDPQLVDVGRPCERCALLVPDLNLRVDDLDIVIGPDIPIRIGRREWAGLPRERDERARQLLWRIDRRRVDRGLRARATGPGGRHGGPLQHRIGHPRLRGSRCLAQSEALAGFDSGGAGLMTHGSERLVCAARGERRTHIRLLLRTVWLRGGTAGRRRLRRRSSQGQHHRDSRPQHQRSLGHDRSFTPDGINMQRPLYTTSRRGAPGFAENLVSDRPESARAYRGRRGAASALITS